MTNNDNKEINGRLSQQQQQQQQQRLPGPNTNQVNNQSTRDILNIHHGDTPNDY